MDNTAGGTFKTFDISYFDPLTSLDYVGDRSNASVDVFSALTNTMVGRIGGGAPPLFSGQTSSFNTSGPDGVLVVNVPGQHQVWAGNGDSTLKGFSIPGYSQFANVVTGPLAANRVDEMAYDPLTNTIMAANNAATPPFASLVNASTGTIVKQVTFDGTSGTPNATNGIEQPAYDSATHTFFVSVPQIGGSGPGGVAEVDPTTGAILHIYDFSTFLGGSITACSPAGLVAGTGGQLLVGCGGSTGSIILNPTANGGNGSVKVISQVTGSDEVTFDPTNNLYFLAASNNPGGPVLGIINGLTDTWIGNIPTTPGDHSISVDPITGKVFMPFAANPLNTACVNGCIGVFAAPEPGSLPLMLSALAALVGFGLLRDRRI
ncbi:MAG TPA: hypothetical protein VND19_16830 [Acetobacteraceae bacterium]|nr:hypothetical protein [Acetobacteraceae bacterium]